MVSDFINKILMVVVPSLVTKLLVVLAKPLYGFVVKIISTAQQHEYLSAYADLEEVLGDFLEKYRDLVKRKPFPSRWGFFVLLFGDSWGLFCALLRLAVQYLLESGNTRA